GVHPTWSWLGLGLAGAGLALLATGDATGSLTMRALSLPAVLAGALLLVIGPGRFTALLFPVLFLAFMAPLPADVIPAISHPLQGLAAWFTAHALPVVGIPAVLDGFSVRIPGYVLDVNESCNGLRFLLAMIVIGAALAWSTRTGSLRRFGIVALAVVMALVANLVRVAGAAIIPTKNRPGLLASIVERLLAQTATIDELVIVDQSDTDEGRVAVRRALEAVPASRRPALDHVWDREINGAAAARNVAFDRTRSDVLLCVDDDMEPGPDAIERLLAHLAAEPKLAAVTPVITNYEAPALPHRLVSQMFFRGPFRDDRQPVYWRGAGQRERLVDVGMLGAGMIAIRRTALVDIRFDARYRGASLGEDLDLSWALRARGGTLAIATDAHVIHRKAPRPASRHEEAMLT